MYVFSVGYQMKKTTLSLFLISIMGLMSACGQESPSSSEQRTSTPQSAPPTAEPISLQPMPEAESHAQFNKKTNARQVKNPTQLINPATHQVEQDLLKSSDVSFSVDDLLKTTQSIEAYVQEAGGYIEQKYINYTVQDRKTHTKSNGEVDVFEKITPQAQLIVRVPNHQTAMFLNRIVPLISQFYTQNYDAKQQDFIRLIEKQKNLVAKEDGTQTQQNIPPELNQLIEKEIKHRIEFSTITLNYHQNAVVRRSTDFDLAGVVKATDDPLSTRLAYSLGLGMKGIVNIFVFLMMFWPLYLLAGGGLWAYRTWKKRHKY